MRNLYKYILLYSILIASVITTIYIIDNYSDNGVEFQKSMLIKQARTHFSSQVQTREWNSKFGGVYVKPFNGLKPNPYLKDNILKVDENLTLIRVNPAWMTRQLSKMSELSDSSNFKFRITSLDPLNPNNIATEFEKKALNYFKGSNKTEYYELHKDNFYYMGALITEHSCLSCHVEQKYKLGDINGGISIELDAREFIKMKEYIVDRADQVTIISTLFLILISFLMHKQFKNQENLANEVERQTKEIGDTKELLQKVLDADKSFLMVAADKQIILANKTMLHFFDSNSLEEFIAKHNVISSFFEQEKGKNYLSAYMGEMHWVEYLQQEQDKKELRVLMRKDSQKRYFKAHSKELIVEGKKLHIIIFDEITQELEKIKMLKNEASRDALTELFNRRKFIQVLQKEMSLAQATLTPLSIIFLDIDHFKIVNDTYGHDVGDSVLVEISKIIMQSVRVNDFVARWGGEEFIVTLQSTKKEHAVIVAQKIRENIQKHFFEQGGKQTVSLGVTEYIVDEIQDSFTKRVDQALYEAKDSGRNCVVVK